MITKPTLEELSNRIPDRYALILTVAKRARELEDGADKLTSFDHSSYLTIAANEIKEGLVKPAERKDFIL